MKKKYFFAIIFFFSSCSGNIQDFDKQFYLKVTRTPLPSGYRVLESHDNAEWLTITSFKVDSSVLKTYIRENKFGALKRFYPRLMGEGYLKEQKPDYKSNTEYYMAGDRGKNHWLFLADVKNEILWVEIIYPDWSDN